MFFVVPDRTTALISHCIKYIVIVIVNLFHGALSMDLHIGPWLYQCPQKPCMTYPGRAGAEWDGE